MVPARDSRALASRLHRKRLARAVGRLQFEPYLIVHSWYGRLDRQRPLRKENPDESHTRTAALRRGSKLQRVASVFRSNGRDWGGCPFRRALGGFDGAYGWEGSNPDQEFRKLLLNSILFGGLIWVHPATMTGEAIDWTVSG